MAIAENVQAGDPQDVQIGSLRAHLKEILDQGKPIEVKRHNRTVALLIPVKLNWWATREEKQRECSRVRKAVHALLTRLAG